MNFKNSCNMEDTQTIGNNFTWRKRRDGPNNLFEKLDRVLVHNQITQWYPNLKTKNHAFTISDHCQISLELSESENFTPHPFKFEMMWTKRKSFENIVKQILALQLYRK